jgi:enterochelin esterase-like enzyme
MTLDMHSSARARTTAPARRRAPAARPDWPVRVHHPLAAQMVLRTSADWDHDLEPVSWSAEGSTAEFRLPLSAGHWAAKPCLRAGNRLIWASGYDIALTGESGGQDLYPQFVAPRQGTVSDRLETPTHPATGPHYMRVYLPPDYDTQPERRYPTIYMQDGANLFFPDESYSGHAWDVQHTMDLLIALGLIRPTIVIGVYPAARMAEYTRPGYEDYGRWLVKELKPAVDRMYRTLADDPESNVVMGSSLGGVVSFYLAWQWPEVFGGAACLSPTFGWRDNLFARVAREARRPGRFYVDSGGPGDNFQAARNMHAALERCGYRAGRDLYYQSFRQARHNERDWAARLHRPLQFLLGLPEPD